MTDDTTKPPNEIAYGHSCNPDDASIFMVIPFYYTEDGGLTWQVYRQTILIQRKDLYGYSGLTDD